MLFDVNHIMNVPLTSFPFPYKYLMGVGLYFYIKSQFTKIEVLYKIDVLLFLPAFFYGVLRLYWYISLHSGIDEDIFWNVYQTGFFVYNEFVYLIFNIILGLSALKILEQKKADIAGSKLVHFKWKWLKKFVLAFLLVATLNLSHQIIVNLLGLQHSGPAYIMMLILNSLYIYWVGFESVKKSDILFNRFIKDTSYNKLSVDYSLIQEKLKLLMDREEMYSNQKLKISTLANKIKISENELSIFIYTNHNMSFSEYINTHRIEKVKQLIQSEDLEKYTLMAIAENAGFSSKSSFNSIFKKMTGLTPSQYKVQIKKRTSKI